MFAIAFLVGLVQLVLNPVQLWDVGGRIVRMNVNVLMAVFVIQSLENVNGSFLFLMMMVFCLYFSKIDFIFSPIAALQAILVKDVKMNALIINMVQIVYQHVIVRMMLDVIV